MCQVLPVQRSVITYATRVLYAALSRAPCTPGGLCKSSEGVVIRAFRLDAMFTKKAGLAMSYASISLSDTVRACVDDERRPVNMLETMLH